MLRSLAYSILNKITKTIRREPPKNYPFEGVYKTLAGVPIINEGYHNNEWLENISTETISKIDSIKAEQFVIAAEQRNNITNLLPLLVSALSRKNHKVSILDFGGGMGVGYLDCLRCLINMNCFFHIVDTIPNNDYARKIYASNPNIKFHDIDIPYDIQKVDIVNTGSSLQYVDDYEHILNALTKLNPEYFFLSDTFMGKMPTFATMQTNMSGKGIPYWIFSYEEIVNFFKNNGYNLTYKSSNYQPFHDLNNFPSDFKLKDSYNLLFSNNDYNDK